MESNFFENNSFRSFFKGFFSGKGIVIIFKILSDDGIETGDLDWVQMRNFFMDK